jgi:hypothetical protein
MKKLTVGIAIHKYSDYSLLIKPAGMVEMVDTLDLGSRFWGFESLFPYKISDD